LKYAGGNADSQIPPSSLSTFTSTYSTLLKSSMAPSMRKRDKKREKAKAEMREKKRKEIWTDVEIEEGGKRGKGHRQRVSPLPVSVRTIESTLWKRSGQRYSADDIV
jgi:hypothetical protein